SATLASCARVQRFASRRRVTGWDWSESAGRPRPRFGFGMGISIRERSVLVAGILRARRQNDGDGRQARKGERRDRPPGRTRGGGRDLLLEGRGERLPAGAQDRRQFLQRAAEGTASQHWRRSVAPFTRPDARDQLRERRRRRQLESEYLAAV